MIRDRYADAVAYEVATFERLQSVAPHVPVSFLQDITLALIQLPVEDVCIHIASKLRSTARGSGLSADIAQELRALAATIEAWS